MSWRAPIWHFLMLLCVLAACSRHGVVGSSEQHPVPETSQSRRTGGILNTHPFVDDTVSGLGGEPPALLRSLEDTATELTIVTLPLQLQEAVFGGAPHVQVEDHLDLSTLDIQYDSDRGETPENGFGDILKVPAMVKTIRGNCATTPTIPGLTSPPLLPLLPLQCLLVADTNVLELLGFNNNVWLDNFYLRARRDDRNRDPGPLVFSSVFQGASLWMTRATVQGDVDGVALYLFPGASLYAEGCTFANLGDANDALLITGSGSTAAFVGCSFLDNTVAYDVFLVGVSAEASVLLRRPLLSGNVASPSSALFGVISGGEIFVEGAAIEVNDLDSLEIFELDGTTPISAAQEAQFLSATDEWFLNAQEEVSALSGSSAIAPTTGEAPMPAESEPVGESPMPAESEPGGESPMPAESEGPVPASGEAIDPAATQPAFTPSTAPPRAPTPEASGPGDLTSVTGTPSAEEAKVSSDSGSSTNVGLIAGVIGGLVALVAASAIAAAAFIFKKRRNQSRAAVAGTVEAQASQDKDYDANTTGAVDLNRSHATASLPHGNSPAGTALGASSDMDRSSQPALLQEIMHTKSTVTTGSRATGQIVPSTTLSTTDTSQQQDPGSAQLKPAPARAVSLPGPKAGESMSMAASAPSHGENSTLDTFEPEPLPDREPPPPNASTAEHMEYLHYQLDISEGQDLLPGLLMLPGMASRFQGGQAIVQITRDTRQNAEFAAKFFVSRRAFQDETALYMDSGNPLGRFLPELRMIVDGLSNQLLDRQGRPFPPCIIMEKGESLDMWSQCNKDVDIFAVMQVIHNIAERLLSMHDCGYVHRDLKQSNIMWLPRTKRWTLIDFGCAAKVGEKAPLSFSLPYAAPEIIRAVKAGQRTIIADTAMDAWALGVVAVELFSNRVALNVLEGKDVVMQRILGELPLPWETGAPGATAVLRSMGRLQQAVLALLQRDPAARIDMATFVKRCRGIFAQSTTATHDTSSTS